jgi:hypothetical protein
MKFDRTKFQGDSIVQYDDRFVARFEHGGRASFLSFLVKNFTVEEYFAELVAGKAPLRILEARGYVQPHIKAILKREGYPQTQEGKRQYLANLREGF